TPAFTDEAAVRALREGYTCYSENAGLPSLRGAIAEQYPRLHGVDLAPDREIVVTASGIQALHLALRSVLDPGDEALILSPAWPNGASIVALSHATPIEATLVLREEQYRIDFSALEAAVGPRTPAAVRSPPPKPPRWGCTTTAVRAASAASR